MLRCPNCHHEQEVGKFCGKCGSPVEEIVAENENVEEDVPHEGSDEVPPTEVLVTEPLEDQATPQEVEQASVQEPSGIEEPAPQQQQAAQRPDPIEPPPTINVGEVKENAVKYWATFSTVLKSPSKAFVLDERHFTFGIINLLVYLLTFTLSIYTIANAIYRDFMEDSIAFFEFSIPVFLLFSIFVAVAIAVLLLFEKMAVKQMTFKEFIAQFSGAITPFIIMNALAFITALAASAGLTIILLQLSFVFSFIITPGFFLLEKLNFYKIREYRLYFSYGVSMAILLVFYIVARLVIDALIGQILDQLYNNSELFRLFQFFD